MLIPFFTILFYSNDPNIVTLNPYNHVSITGPITTETYTQFIKNIELIDQTYIYIYISSIGGDVVQGDNIIQYMQYKKLQNKQLLCIAHKALSMAFHILQHCTHRYVIPSSILMQHQIYLTIGGELLKVKNYINYIDKINTRYINIESKRLLITPNEYENKISNEWWLYGKENIDNNIADVMLDGIGCSKTLVKQNDHNNCPLI